jgi:hypothetical protein
MTRRVSWISGARLRTTAGPSWLSGRPGSAPSRRSFRPDIAGAGPLAGTVLPQLAGPSVGRGLARVVTPMSARTQLLVGQVMTAS